MKKMEIVKTRFTGTKIITFILAAVIAFMVAVLGMAVVGQSSTPAHAAGGTITLHIYDPAQEYDSLAGWLWVRGGSGTEHKMLPVAANEQFAMEYEDNGTKIKNVARTFEVKFTDAQMSSLKNGTQLGFLVCKAKPGGTGKFWDRYEKETADVFVDVSEGLKNNGHVDVYYVRKDIVAYLNLEEAIKSLGKITSAVFKTKSSSSVTIAFESSMPFDKGASASLYDGDTKLDTKTIKVSDSNSCEATVSFNTKFNFSADYKLEVAGINTKASVSKMLFIDDPGFIEIYESVDTQNQVLGCTYTPGATTFRVWAPLASSVAVVLYDSGTGGNELARHGLSKRVPEGGTWGGIWEFTLNGNHLGKYYTYVACNNGVETETMDPYAKACGANGLRGMIVDLDSTDPDGWDADINWWKTTQDRTAYDTPIIWEVAVGDFSSSPDSGMKYKGKYLAFTEQNTTVPGTTLKTGVSYLKDLGITYVHLNPVFDFASSDETDLTRADGSTYNWGYDPQNYNIPEGSYSTDPSNGTVRINEFKQMVKALHDAGIGVVMDVVYNHTFNTAGQAFHDLVPYYYHRTEADGKFSNDSGCGNGTASERTMMRKFMVESLTYWAEEYHIDGFRFDLMGIHDIVTLNLIRDELDKLDGGNGKRLLMYGEPWDGYYNKTPYSYTKRVQATKSGTKGKFTSNANNNPMRIVYGSGFGSNTAFDALRDRIAVFNDSGREGLRGGCWERTPGQGWANGAPGNYKRVRRMIEGGIGGWGFDDAEGLFVGLGSRNVAYACAHDNFTLWDQIRGKKSGEESALFYDDPVEDTVKRCKLVASAYLMSTGMCFMIAGEEMGRTKYGNENSYNSPVKLNQITWSRQQTFKNLHDYYQSLIKLRKKYSKQLFSYSKSTTAAFSYGSNFTGDGETGAISFTRTQGGVTLTMSLNPSTLTGSVKVGTDAALTF